MKVKLEENGILPTRGSEFSAGYDLYSPTKEILELNSPCKIDLCIKIETMKGTFGQINDRSSMAIKGIRVLGGIIDEDYRGNVSVVLINLGKNPIEIKKGDKIAQIILLPYRSDKVEQVKILSESQRGIGGFGSTGR